MRSTKWIPLSGLAVACALVAAVLAGCSGPQLKVVDSGATYTMDQAQNLAKTTPVGDAGSLSTQAAPQAREKLLVGLRRQGAEGAMAADLLTKGFPATTPAVPVLIQKATVDGKPSIVVVEATPGPGGKLTSRRLWVFDAATGQVTGSASVR